ncbi:SUKH-4 family immunity protein [Streptomyces xiaopingdaonensis]|uniref:SUKH-4 family immunity protein n=1 Tax=Streptomyces xiaopingdaonensis TaxID=1565415 RepID=UPI0003063E76|nr:SUKH-4 family immunity protein [Streptomyces xiaopingdaonensis]
MVTLAQAQERAERWINGTEVPSDQRREAQVREFALGFVAWAGPASPEAAGPRLVIAKDSGDATLWPGLPVDEVVRNFEEEYGGSPAPAAAPAPERLDLEATSFLLTPPEWLQQAADQLGVPDRRSAEEPAAESSVPAASGSAPSPWDAADTSGSGGVAQQPPATVFAPPLSGDDEEESASSGSHSEARTELMPEGSSLPGVAAGRPVEEADSSPSQGGSAGLHHAATVLSEDAAVQVPPSPDAARSPGVGDIADADTSRAAGGPVSSRSSRGGPTVPPPPGAPGTPGARPGAGYVPTQLVSSDDVAQAGAEGGGAASGSDSQGGGVHHAATVLSDGSQGGAPIPPPPGTPGAPGAGSSGGDVHQASTMLAGGQPSTPAAPGPPPSAPGPPPAPGTPPPAPGTPPPAPGAPAPGGPAPAYGYPQQPSAQPTVGPGYMAVLRYRAADGSEQQLIRRSAPGTPHPEWQLLHELHGMNVPPQQVVELHTELESCELPGGYCARMVRETWPQVRVSHTAAYGRDHASRQDGMRQLLAHQGELHQVADGPARPAPHRVPLPPQVQPAPPLPPDGIGQELLQAFGPQGVFRFDQRAVSRQGVPDVVAQTLVWAGIPIDMGPFFWGQAQPGRPVPTLAELAQERGVQPSSDAGSYLVMGTDFGRQLCVQYGTANIVAVPLEAGPGGQPAQPQFVNTGLPEFVRSLALLGRMWRLRYGLTQEQAGRWTVDFQLQLAAFDAAALASPENWWSVLLEQMWDGLF